MFVPSMPSHQVPKMSTREGFHCTINSLLPTRHYTTGKDYWNIDLEIIKQHPVLLVNVKQTKI